MNPIPFAAEKIDDIKRSVDKHEGEKEDWQHYHMEQLRDKTSEKPWNLIHFSHNLGGTKLNNIFINPKYSILVPNTPDQTQFYPKRHTYFKIYLTSATFALVIADKSNI